MGINYTRRVLGGFVEVVGSFLYANAYYGDSGGPLLRKTDAGYEIIGVASMGIDSFTKKPTKAY